MTITTDVPPPSLKRKDAAHSEPVETAMFHPVKWALAELTNAAYGASILLEAKDAKRFRHYANMGVFAIAREGNNLRVWNVDPKADDAP